MAWLLAAFRLCQPACSASPSMLFERMHSLVAARLSLEAWLLAAFRLCQPASCSGWS